MPLLSYIGTIVEYLSHHLISRQALEAKQLAKFRRLVAHANEHSPHYSRIIKERAIDLESCAPADFPVLTKDDLIDNFDEIVTDRALTYERVSRFVDDSGACDNMLDGKYYAVHTSGTSGKVSYSLFTREEWDKGHIHFGRINRTGALNFRRRYAQFSSMDGHVHGALVARLNQKGLNSLFFNARPYDINQPLSTVIADLNDFQPSLLAGYGGSLRILAEAQEAGDLQIRPRQLMYGGEALGPEQRKYVSGIFNADVKSVYACSEHLIMGGTIEGTDIMQMFEDNLMFEFEPDHLLVTNLYNYTMPMIRHRLDDTVKPLGVRRWPYPFTTIETLIGRQEKMMWFVNNRGDRDFIHPNAIFAFFVPNLRAFQIEQVDETRFTFRAQLALGLSDPEREEAKRRTREKMMEILAQKEMTDVEFDVLVVDDIAVDRKTGKFRTIVVPKELDAA